MKNYNLKLRSYQQDLIDRVYARFETCDSVMAQLPTGGGKSVIFGAITSHFANQGLRVLCLAHREELVLQGANHIRNWVNVAVGIIKSGHQFDPYCQIQFASIQTILRRLDCCGEFDIVIVDECHHCTSNTYLHVLNRYKNAKVLGLTATPIRTDNKGFNDIFQALECGVTTKELIAAGHLSDYKMFADPRKMIVKGAKKVLGDFSTSDLAKLNDAVELAGDLIASYKQYANNGTCMVFAINVEHSQTIAKAYNDAGISALHLDAKTDKNIRRQALVDLKSGELKVITNVGLMGEGVDVPTLDCIQIARPTASLALHLQILGRVLRVAEGKEYGIILEHTDNAERLGLPEQDREWSLFPPKLKSDKRKESDEQAKAVPKNTEIEHFDIELGEVDRDAMLDLLHQKKAELFLRKVLAKLFPSTRNLLKHHGKPIKLTDSELLIQVASKGLLEVFNKKADEIVKAIFDSFGRKLAVNFVVRDF